MGKMTAETAHCLVPHLRPQLQLMGPVAFPQAVTGGPKQFLLRHSRESCLGIVLCQMREESPITHKRDQSAAPRRAGKGPGQSVPDSPRR